MSSHRQTVAAEASMASSGATADGAARRSFAQWRTEHYVVLLTLTAAILRIAFLGSKSLYFDESMAEYRGRISLSSLAYVLTHGEMNMSLYYLMLHGWVALAGTSEFMLRFPSALLAIATVPLIYVLGAELKDRRTGLLAALLLTVNATAIRYAQTARSYSLLLALGLLATIFFLRSVKRRTPAGLIGYVVCSAASVYAHLFGVLALPSEWLSLFLFRPGRKAAVILTTAMVVAGLLAFPAFYFAITGEHGNVAWVHETSVTTVGELLLTFIGSFDGAVSILTVLLAALYLTGIALAVVRAPRSERPVLGFLVLSICVPIVLTIAVSLHKPVFVLRYLLGGLPFVALLAAMGFQRLRPAFVVAIAVAITTLGLAEDCAYYRAPAHEDWRAAIAYIAAQAQPGDRLLIVPPDYSEAIEYYVARLDHPEQFPQRVLQSDYVIGANISESPEQLLAESDAGAGTRIWVAVPFWSPFNKVSFRMLLPKERVLEEPKFAGLRVLLMQRRKSNPNFRHF